MGGNGTHDVGICRLLKTCIFALRPLLVPLDLLFRNRDIAHDVGRLGGVIMRGRVGGGRGDREGGCGRGGLGGCEGRHGRTDGAALDEVPLLWWYVPCRTLR